MCLAQVDEGREQHPGAFLDVALVAIGDAMRPGGAGAGAGDEGEGQAGDRQAKCAPGDQGLVKWLDVMASDPCRRPLAVKVVDDEVMGMRPDLPDGLSLPQVRVGRWKVVVPVDHHVRVLGRPEDQDGGYIIYCA